MPERDHLIRVAARHLELIVEANRQFNLTRILDSREAAIKHVVDSIMPWRLFAAAKHVLDAGTGAGFPGVPLAVVLPSVHFTLAESIGKKARFVEAAVKDLALAECGGRQSTCRRGAPSEAGRHHDGSCGRSHRKSG